MSVQKPIAIFWFRRDLRLHDNTGLQAALASGIPVLPLFIFDRRILDALEDRNDRRVEFIHGQILEMQKVLVGHGSMIQVEHGDPIEILTKVFTQYSVKQIYFNHDYEPYATERDTRVKKLCKSAGCDVFTFKDQVIFEKLEVEKGTKGPYSVFTPYSRKWKELLKPEMLKSRDGDISKLVKLPPKKIPSLKSLGFVPGGLAFPPSVFDKKVVKTYEDTRNIPSVPGTSRLGLHLRFGTMSIRELVKLAKKTNDTWLGELIWREFFMQILWNYPNVIHGPFRPQYSRIQYLDRDEDFRAWTEGKTGYPIVDAGMRELNETGFMHNRVRMVAASLLVKHLLVHPKRGEAYFARKLLDFELSSNNGNWQWVAGSGCDASPYFRVFNPLEQARKFDPKQIYIQHWIPEFGTEKYPDPIVEHKMARERVLKVYKEGLYGNS